MTQHFDTRNFPTWQLSRMAACGEPDRADGEGQPPGGPPADPSPGAIFLRDVADSMQEYHDGDNWTDYDHDDIPSEIADNAVYTLESRGTHRKWMAFVDLAAYQEDLSEYGPIDGLEAAANTALYDIARRLVDGLLEAAVNEDEDDR